jgi:hypothetical protein
LSARRTLTSSNGGTRVFMNMKSVSGLVVARTRPGYRDARAASRSFVSSIASPPAMSADSRSAARTRF